MAAEIIPDDAMIYITYSLLIVGVLIISIFGIGTNVLNMIVFIKDGLQDSISVSFFALTLSDLSALILTAFSSFCFVMNEIYQAVVVVAAAWYRSMFRFISTLITLSISLKRCLCVLLPFQFSGFMTKTKTIAFMIVFYTISFILYLPNFLTQQLGWRFDRRFNKTRLLLYYTKERSQVEIYNLYFLTIGFYTVALICVAISTIIMAGKLKASMTLKTCAGTLASSTNTIGVRNDGSLDSDSFTKSHDVNNYVTNKEHSGIPRRTIASSQNLGKENPKQLKQDSFSREFKSKNKRYRIIQMVSGISIIFIACSIPAVIMAYFRSFQKSWDPLLENDNIVFTCFAIMNVFNSINCSINILVYYKLGTKYRAIYKQIFVALCPRCFSKH